MDSTDTTLNNSDSVFIYIKNILMSDANLCNFSRYMDYGKIKKDASSGKVFWTTEKSVLNDSNKVNNTQLVRFVQKIDTKFLLKSFCPSRNKALSKVVIHLSPASGILPKFLSSK